MRRSKSTARRIPIRSAATVAVIAVASFGTLGCEDGPTQPYAPATPAETNVWNNPNGNNVSPSTKNFSFLSGGTNANVICNGPTLAKVWAAMDQQPIVPPIAGAGLDMAGPDCSLGNPNCSWTGLTIEDAEQILCQATNIGDLFGNGELDDAWGDSEEVIAEYSVSTHIIDQLTITPGYLGTTAATGCAGTASAGHTYTVPINTQLLKDGVPWEINWTDPRSPTDWRNELTSAVLCTFAGPGIAAAAGDCNSTGACIQGAFGDAGYIFIDAIGIGFINSSTVAAQPIPSIFTEVQEYYSKVTPYEGAAPNLKIDGKGPTAEGGVLGSGAAGPCEMGMGSTFGDFVNDCIEVTGNQTTDLGQYNKVLGGIQHDDERFFFNVQGVDLNFADGRLMPLQVVTDADRPASTDVATEFSIDQFTLGPIVQDYTGNNGSQPKDAHGNGLVYLEMARLAEAALVADEQVTNPAFPVHFIGDPACSDNNPSATPGGASGPAAGCTGLETIITTAPVALVTSTTTIGSVPCTAGNAGCSATGTLVTVPSTLTAPELAFLKNAALPTGTNILDPNAPTVLSSQRLGMRPGTQNVAYCPDPTNLLGCPTTYQGLTIPTSKARLLAILGGGNLATLPVDAQDVRFFFKNYVMALLKYLKAEGAATAAGTDPSAVTLADVDAQFIDPYGLFFDSIGAGQFEQAEYVERAYSTGGSFPGTTAPPLDFVFSADVIHGIMNGYDFSQYLYRGETTMYTAMLDERDGKPHTIGSQDNALLTNMFGSTVLHAGWADHTADSGPQYTAFYCATNNDPVPCGGATAPLDANGNMVLDVFGRPYLTAYEGAFAGNATDFTIGGGTGMSSPVAVSVQKGTGDVPGTGTYQLTQEIAIQVPLHANPYNLTSATPPSGQSVSTALIPWAPKQPGIGFPVALDGQREQFIETYQMDFSGEQITANVDYDFSVSAAGTPTSQILFLAVETTDFLGDVFVCQDTNTKDLLTAQMYTSVSTILQWIAAHPTSYTDCNLILEYSPYENYLDYVNSQSNGVRLSSTQGGGFGRIVDGTLFDPNLPNHVLSN